MKWQVFFFRLSVFVDHFYAKFSITQKIELCQNTHTRKTPSGLTNWYMFICTIASSYTYYIYLVSLNDKYGSIGHSSDSVKSHNKQTKKLISNKYDYTSKVY